MGIFGTITPRTAPVQENLLGDAIDNVVVYATVGCGVGEGVIIVGLGVGEVGANVEAPCVTAIKLFATIAITSSHMRNQRDGVKFMLEALSPFKLIYYY